ncbi:MAG TPA: hypothetical protein VJB59_07220 [Bdellovibrionota bacterium]|nr:hypothetical protein [Bdellovibrionota bacterium]
MLKQFKRTWVLVSVVVFGVAAACATWWVVKNKNDQAALAAKGTQQGGSRLFSPRSVPFTPVRGLSPQEAPLIAKDCEKGNQEACARLQAFTMGFSNFAVQQQSQSRKMLETLCKNNKPDACKALATLNRQAGQGKAPPAAN